ncbi:MAG: zinc ribbon domain-containing protein [Bacilli bacterium]
MYCKQCGAKISNSAKFCDVCGAQVENDDQFSYEGTTINYDNTNYGIEQLETMTILALVFSFVQPIVGLILAHMTYDKNYGPKNDNFSRVATIIASVSLGLLFFLCLILFILSGSGA